MARCPTCGSRSATRVRAQERRVHRLLFLAKAKCGHCFDVFLTPSWSVVEEAATRRRVNAQPVTDLSGSQKRSIF